MHHLMMYMKLMLGQAWHNFGWWWGWIWNKTRDCVVLNRFHYFTILYILLAGGMTLEGSFSHICNIYNFVTSSAFSSPFVWSILLHPCFIVWVDQPTVFKCAHAMHVGLNLKQYKMKDFKTSLSSWDIVYCIMCSEFSNSPVFIK